ncbi:Asparagine-rich zinc finger protein AZF1 [Lachnellula arida]|uniref:Asparagine-rich zinc finger protein AZF1 n=1 Tax=Lachnellula arida TaxID=1316785 RepID=A0A8T9BJK7_9HELO|nr:Asparagine-rich zinc finger protein AZF1 [Lachnellula arida]
MKSCIEQDTTATLAVTALAPGQAWGRWSEQQSQPSLETYYTMDNSGLIQTYNPRTTSSTALTRATVAPQYVPAFSYGGATASQMATCNQHPQQHNPFVFGTFTGGHSTGSVPPFDVNYIRQRPHLAHSTTNGDQGNLYTRNPHEGYVEEHHSHSPQIKREPQWNGPVSSKSSDTAEPQWNRPVSSKSSDTAAFLSTITKTITPVNGADEVNFGTEVDMLMKAIQAKSQATMPQTPSLEQKRPVVGASITPPLVRAPKQRGGDSPSREASKLNKLTHGKPQEEKSSMNHPSKKRYQCTIDNCGMSFPQKTHLDIHERKHTGERPYACKRPDCGKFFSQVGNLKTHERRHTGEKPYACDICGKRFPQRGNVRSHRLIHYKKNPYLCRLEDCGKKFTTLGNLKSHQNKFHIATIRALTSKFASIKDGDIVHSADKELWEYFANLYKNSNKGIKGRGKDRKVGTSSRSSSKSMALKSGMRNSGVNASSYTGAGRSDMGMAVPNGDMAGLGRGHMHDGQYEMIISYDADDGSQSSHSGSSTVSGGSSVGTCGGSSVGTCYEDVHPDGFEDHGRSHQLAFGDRLY